MFETSKHITTWKVWAHHLLNGAIIIGAVRDTGNIFRLSKPVTVIPQRAAGNNITMQFGPATMPLNPPKSAELDIMPSAIILSYELDDSNNELLVEYRKTLTSVLLDPDRLKNHRPILDGGTY